jgi:hypothetical protein
MGQQHSLQLVIFCVCPTICAALYFTGTGQRLRAELPQLLTGLRERAEPLLAGLV